MSQDKFQPVIQPQQWAVDTLYLSSILREESNNCMCSMRPPATKWRCAGTWGSNTCMFFQHPLAFSSLINSPRPSASSATQHPARTNTHSNSLWFRSQHCNPFPHRKLPACSGCSGSKPSHIPSPGRKAAVQLWPHSKDLCGTSTTTIILMLFLMGFFGFFYWIIWLEHLFQNSSDEFCICQMGSLMALCDFKHCLQLINICTNFAHF